MDKNLEENTPKTENDAQMEFWQNQPDSELSRDLDFEEIADLNRLPDEEEETRGGAFWFFVAIAFALLFFFQAFIFHDAINSFFYAQKIAHTQVPDIYRDNQMMLASREAVVLIRGDSSRGSGFNIDPQGLIITNRHVVRNENAVMVYFPDGSYYLCTAWRISPDSDLAVLMIDGEGLPFIPLADSELKEKAEVYFIGSPESSWWLMTKGELVGYYSNKNSFVMSIRLGEAIGPGASGSPILDGGGEAVGVIFAVSSGDAREAYAIPAEILREYLSSSGYY